MKDRLKLFWWLWTFGAYNSIVGAFFFESPFLYINFIPCVIYLLILRTRLYD